MAILGAERPPTLIYLLDHFIIQVPSVYDERPGEFGLIKINHAFYIDKERDRFERKLLFGTIIAAPMGYSDSDYMPVDSGIPNYKLFIGHEAIQRQVNIGHKEWGEKYEHYYHPGRKECFDFLTMQHYGDMIDAKVGDTVYFHPSVTEEENYISDRIYRANGDKLICVVGEQIRMQAGYMLVDPHFDEQLEESGFIIKSAGEAKMLEGTIRHIRTGAELKEGDSIIFQDDANWDLEVEGKKYYAMKEEDALMRVLA